jgi:flagellar biosynthesis/type III secretory pathway protein FliH
MAKVQRYLAVLLTLCVVSLVGCNSSSRAVDEAYARGYGDGVAAAEEALTTAEKAYQAGYEDGLADAVKTANVELCQSCYGLGYSEGYQAAAGAGVAGGA